MRRYLPLFAGAALLIACGLVHGLWTDRWVMSAALRDCTSRMTTLPMTVGDWDGSTTELDARQLAVADVAGHLSRRYVQRHTGREVDVLLLCGRGGPVSVHQPDVCYTGAGYQPNGAPEKWTEPDGPAGMWMARFAKPGSDPAPLRIFWAWSAAGDWKAADHPRLEFGRQPAMYKLYVVHRMTRPDEPLDESAGRDFLRVLLPELRRSLKAG